MCISYAVITCTILVVVIAALHMCIVHVNLIYCMQFTCMLCASEKITSSHDWHSCIPYLTTTPQDYRSFNNTSSCHRHHHHLCDHHYCHHHHRCCRHHGHWLSSSSLHVVPFSNVGNRTIVVTTAVVITNHYVTQNNVEEQHKSSYGFPHDSCKYHGLVFLFLRCMRMHLKQSFLKPQKLFIMKRETDICRRQM